MSPDDVRDFVSKHNHDRKSDDYYVYHRDEQAFQKPIHPKDLLLTKVLDDEVAALIPQGAEDDAIGKMLVSMDKQSNSLTPGSRAKVP